MEAALKRWASGAEWDGWTRRRDERRIDGAELMTINALDSECDGVRFMIDDTGNLTIYTHESVEISFPSPEAARIAAMAIIEGMK